MKIYLKPNPNSARYSEQREDYLYDMVDLLDPEGGSVWGSTHIDLFSPCKHGTRNLIYDKLLHGDAVMVELKDLTEADHA